MEALPPPACLPAELEHLSLAGNRLRSLPPTLAAATALTALNISNNPQLALNMWGVYTLAALPRLQRLVAWGTATLQPLWCAAQEAMPRLQVVSEPPSDGEESDSEGEEEEEWDANDSADSATSAPIGGE